MVVSGPFIITPVNHFTAVEAAFCNVIAIVVRLTWIILDNLYIYIYHYSLLVFVHICPGDFYTQNWLPIARAPAIYIGPFGASPWQEAATISVTPNGSSNPSHGLGASLGTVVV